MSRTPEYNEKVLQFCKRRGAFIRELRENSNISQKEVARYIGIHQCTYSLFERGGIDSLYMFVKAYEYIYGENTKFFNRGLQNKK